MKNCIALALLLFSLQSMAQKNDEGAIKQILANQETAWNEGNLNQFMVGYWQSDSLLFVGKRGPTYGYDSTLANYKKSYPDLTQMGHLTSTVISLKKISLDNYLVVGKWYLKRTVGDISGYYTLLFQKIKGHWVIIADHSS